MISRVLIPLSVFYLTFPFRQQWTIRLVAFLSAEWAEICAVHDPTVFESVHRGDCRNYPGASVDAISISDPRVDGAEQTRWRCSPSCSHGEVSLFPPVSLPRAYLIGIPRSPTYLGRLGTLRYINLAWLFFISPSSSPSSSSHRQYDKGCSSRCCR